MKEKRPEVVAKYPNLKVTEIAKKIGELWKNLSDAEKQVYKDLAAKGGGSSGSTKKSSKSKGKSKKGSDSD
jgi:hypothetical protein